LNIKAAGAGLIANNDGTISRIYNSAAAVVKTIPGLEPVTPVVELVPGQW
jgi:hypothetical protein